LRALREATAIRTCQWPGLPAWRGLCHSVATHVPTRRLGKPLVGLTLQIAIVATGDHAS